MSSSTPSTPNVMAPDTPRTAQRVGGRVVPLDGFPRKGAFCVVAGHLGIVASLGKRGTIDVEEADPSKTDGSKRTVTKTFIDASEPFAEVHLVETNETRKHYGHFRRAPDDFPTGEPPIGDVQERGGEIFNVPFDKIERAPWSLVGPVVDARNGADPKPDLLWASRAGYLLSDEETAQLPSLLDAEVRAAADAAKFASHPDARAAEEEIALETAAFVARIAAKREAVAAVIRKGLTA